MDTYVVRYRTPQGVIPFYVDAYSWVLAIAKARQIPAVKPEWDIVDCALYARPFDLDDELPDNARPLRRDLD